MADAGIKRVTGRVLVDVSLFPEGARELGTGEAISPIVVNDNAIDITFRPGAKPGDQAALTIAPAVPYIHFVNKIVTVEGDKNHVDESPPIARTAASTVVLTGSVGLASRPVIYGYPLASPSRFAATLLTSALKDAGVKVGSKPGTITAEARYHHRRGRDAQFSRDDMRIASMSPRLCRKHQDHPEDEPEFARQHHALRAGRASGPCHRQDRPRRALRSEHDFLAKAGLDLSGASQADGAGGAVAAFYTPDFVVHYLDFMSRQPQFQMFRDSLPVLGKDGTLVDARRIRRARAMSSPRPAPIADAITSTARTGC